MKLDLPEDVTKSLPEPDSEGLIRITVALRMSDDGKASAVEMNDIPVSQSGDNDKDEETETDEDELEGFEAPDPSEMERTVYGGN